MATKNNDKRLIRLAKGTARSLGKVKNVILPWSEVCELLGTVTRTPEKFKEFKALPQDERNKLKGIAGWLLGGHCDGERRTKDAIKQRDILTFDLDDATEDLIFELENGSTGITDFEFFWHTTRSHTAEAPKVRIFIPLKEAIPSDRYDAVCRIVGQKIDSTMDQIDPVSFRVSQLMYLPTASKNGEFKCGRNRGQLLDAQEVLDAFAGDWKDYTQLPHSEQRGLLRPSAKKAENPHEKKGIIGAFCRAYDVEEAIAEFLPDIYAPGDEHSSKPRYTYLLGSGANGVVVEDDGLFIYSHHGTDPCGDRLCNAWDMVRLHKFGDEDVEAKADTPISKMPSHLAMADWASKLPRVKEQLIQERYDIAAMFEDAGETAGYTPEDQEEAEVDDEIEDLIGTPRGPQRFDIRDTLAPKKRKAPPKDWATTLLDMTPQGVVLPTLHNAAMIIRCDPRLHGAIAYNEFTQETVLRRNILTKTPSVPPLYCKNPENGDLWTDSMDNVIRCILEAPSGPAMQGWGLKVSDRDMKAAIDIAASFNPFNPVLEMWSRLPEWDGVERLPRLFIDYLGTPDDSYHRETATLIVVASISRVLYPGHKFDTAPILSGPQGIRKSTFIKALFGEEYVGEFSRHFTDDKQIVEAMKGRLGVELPELSSLYKSESNDTKHQMTIQVDRVRLSYDRRAKDYPRKAVFMGTTNSDTYLKDATGNRRWWPIEVCVDYIDTDRLVENRPQIWAEALKVYEEIRQTHRADNMPLYLRSSESQTVALARQDQYREEGQEDVLAAAMGGYLDKPRPLSVFLGTAEHEGLALDAADEPMVIPCVTSAAQAFCGATGTNPGDYMKMRGVNITAGLAMARVRGWKRAGRARFPAPWGGPLSCFVRADCTASERSIGYRVVSRPEDDLI